MRQCLLCVCVCVSEWQLTRPHSWSLWGRLCLLGPAAGTLSWLCWCYPLASLPIAVHGRHRVGGRLEVEGIRAAAVGGTIICIRRFTREAHRDLEMGWPGSGVTSWLSDFRRSTEVVTSQTPGNSQEGKANTGGSTTISVARQKSVRVLPQRPGLVLGRPGWRTEGREAPR